MKDSSIEWIGKIPEDWKIPSVSKIYEIQLGKMLQPMSRSPDDELVHYLKSENVHWGYFIKLEKLPKMWANSFEIEKYGVKKGDLLVCEGGEGGRCNILSKNIENCIIQNALHRVRSKENSSIEYLMYFLIACGNAGWFDVINNKATIAHFTRDKFALLKMSLPPIDVQTRIAKFLQIEITKIDSEFVKNQKLIRLLIEKRQSTIHQIITKGLDPTVPIDNFGIEWIGELPKHWKTIKNKFIFKISKNVVGVRSSEIQLLSMGKRGVNYRNKDDGKGKFPESFDGYQIVEPKDLIFCLFDIDETPRTIGYSKLHGMITSAYDVVKCFPEVDPKFIYYLYLSIDDRKGLRPFYTGLRKVVKSDRFLDLKIKIPSLSEQKQIIKFLDNQTKKINLLILKTYSQIQNLTEFKQSLILPIVTGKLNITN